jgi:hypothetical protein
MCFKVYNKLLLLKLLITKFYYQSEFKYGDKNI